MSDWQRSWRPWRKIAAEYGLTGRWPMAAKRGPTRRTAVILDVDGTLFRMNGEPHKQGMAYAKRMHELGHVLVIVSARDREHETRRTKAALRRHMQVPWVGPILRSRSDMRHACVFKSAVADSLSTVFDVVGAIDDDKWCLNMWRERGLEVEEALPLAWSRTFDGPLPVWTATATHRSAGVSRWDDPTDWNTLAAELEDLLDEFPSLRLADAVDIIGEKVDEGEDFDERTCRYCPEPEWDFGSELCALHWDEYSGRETSG